VGCSELTNYRRGPDLAVGAAIVAAVIALAPAAGADTDVDPFQDLFGTAGINTWTVAADSSLDSTNPTLAASFDASVDNFLAAVQPYAHAGFLEFVNADFPQGDDPFSSLVWTFDPTAFDAFAYSAPFTYGSGLPLNGVSDFAVGLDYALFASGIGGTDVAIWDLLSPVEGLPDVINTVEFVLDFLLAGLLLG